MLQVFRHYLNASCDKWLGEIAPPTKKGKKVETKIDISVEFERIVAHSISHICFGADLNDDRFEFQLFDTTSSRFSAKRVSLQEAILNLKI